MTSRPYFFPTRKREAIRSALVDAGVKTIPAITLRRMERHAQRYLEAVSGEEIPTLQAADRLYRIGNCTLDIFVELLAVDMSIRQGLKKYRGLRALAQALGAEYSPEDQVAAGEQILMQCAVVAERVCMKSGGLAEDFECEFWSNPNKVDRCLMRLCADVATEWGEATGQHLPRDLLDLILEGVGLHLFPSTIDDLDQFCAKLAWPRRRKGPHDVADFGGDWRLLIRWNS